MNPVSTASRHIYGVSGGRAQLRETTYCMTRDECRHSVKRDDSDFDPITPAYGALKSK